MRLFMAITAVAICLCFCPVSADAAVRYTITQTNPVPASAVFNMRTVSSITFHIANTSTAGETITTLRFRILNTVGLCGTAPCTNTLFSNTTAAPAGWTRSAFSTTSVTFTASAVANRIPAGGSQDFTIAFNMGNMTADFTQTLRDVRATFSTGATSTITAPGSWKLVCLALITSPPIQITDCAGTQITSAIAGSNFCLVMTIQNNSSVTQNGIDYNPKPLTGANVSKTGTVTQVLGLTTYNPNPLNLAALATGTITLTYATAGTDNGTIQFVNINAQRGATVTSILANSTILTVTHLNISIAITGPVAGSPTCVFSGDTATFTMSIQNNTGSAVSFVTPSVLTQCAYPPCIPTANIGAFTGPAPACIASIAGSGGTGTFTWTAPITGTIQNPKSNFYVTGNVNYNKASCGAGGGITSVTATSNTEDLDGYLVTVAPTSTNTSSTDEELTWAVTNLGCAAVQQVSIAGSIPAGWTWTGGDSYSLVGNSNLETWTVGAANPPVVFTAPTPADQLPLSQSGSFSLVYPTTPAAAAYTFNITITDANATPISQTLPTNVTVNAYLSGGSTGPNATSTGVWHEDVR